MGPITVFSDGYFVSGGAGGGTTLIWTPGGVLANITDSVTPALPVVLLHPSETTTNFQFSFNSESGFTHTVLYRTNLVAGAWMSYTNFPGDGTLKSISGAAVLLQRFEAGLCPGRPNKPWVQPSSVSTMPIRMPITAGSLRQPLASWKK